MSDICKTCGIFTGTHACNPLDINIKNMRLTIKNMGLTIKHQQAEIQRLQSIIQDMREVDDVSTSTMQLNEQDAFEQYMQVTGWSPDVDSEKAFRYAYKHGFKYAPCIEIDNDNESYINLSSMQATEILELTDDLKEAKRLVNLRCGQLQRRDEQISELAAKVEDLEAENDKKQADIDNFKVQITELTDKCEKMLNNY